MFNEEGDSKKAEEVIKRLKKFTKHKFVRITDRGNSAIFVAIGMAKKINPRSNILIPDQGGWLSFKKYPSFFNYHVREVKTDYGIIDLKSLKAQIENSSALILTSFAGYFAEQPIRKIAKVCHDNGCLLIEDASGALGDSKLCKGKYSDIILGSFGRGTSANYGYGGFVSADKPEFFDKAKEVFSTIKVHPEFYNGVLPSLNNKRLKAVLSQAEKVKKDLRKFDVLHRDKRGLNVVAKFDPYIVEYCIRNNYPYILCPNYMRVNEKAISIELNGMEL